ncbi:hypothetical protein ACOSQ3_019516 [Xanthoceras sorbifolium]
MCPHFFTGNGGAFMFYVYSEPMKTTKLMKTIEEPYICNGMFSNSKRTRADSGAVVEEFRKSGNDSFKAKLLNISSPRDNWSGFGSNKEKLKINEGDIIVMDSPRGLEMILSSNLKHQLCKP